MRVLRLPTNGLPSSWILKQITYPPPQSYFLCRTDHFGNNLPPLITLSQQEEIRLVCTMMGIDAEKAVGLPALAIKEEREASTALTNTEKRMIETYDRQVRIEDNMADMKDKIAAYRQGRKDMKNKNKSDMPF